MVEIKELINWYNPLSLTPEKIVDLFKEKVKTNPGLTFYFGAELMYAYANLHGVMDGNDVDEVINTEIKSGKVDASKYEKEYIETLIKANEKWVELSKNTIKTDFQEETGLYNKIINEINSVINNKVSKPIVAKIIKSIVSNNLNSYSLELSDMKLLVNSDNLPDFRINASNIFSYEPAVVDSFMSNLEGIIREVYGNIDSLTMSYVKHPGRRLRNPFFMEFINQIDGGSLSDKFSKTNYLIANIVEFNNSVSKIDKQISIKKKDETKVKELNSLRENTIKASILKLSLYRFIHDFNNYAGNFVLNDCINNLISKGEDKLIEISNLNSFEFVDIQKVLPNVNDKLFNDLQPAINAILNEKFKDEKSELKVKLNDYKKELEQVSKEKLELDSKVAAYETDLSAKNNELTSKYFEIASLKKEIIKNKLTSLGRLNV
ncbi:MAG TPA: hypothetical protein VI790_02225 [Candidatus Nanoarchaeia archaeon]|nr:hypothetical protein [Candidatus Nanoarchaeia archaeon]